MQFPINSLQFSPYIIITPSSHNLPQCNRIMSLNRLNCSLKSEIINKNYSFLIKPLKRLRINHIMEIDCSSSKRPRILDSREIDQISFWLDGPHRMTSAYNWPLDRRSILSLPRSAAFYFIQQSFFLFVPTIEINAPHGSDDRWFWNRPCFTQEERDIWERRTNFGNFSFFKRIWNYSYFDFKFNFWFILPSTNP